MMHTSLEEQEAARQAGKKYYPVAIIKAEASEEGARRLLAGCYPDKKFRLCHTEERIEPQGCFVHYGFIG